MQTLRRLSGAVILTCAALTIVPTQLQPRAVASSRSCFAYVANFDSDTVSVISVASNSVVSTIAVGDGPEGVAITPDGTKAYVTNDLSDTVTVINIATNTTTSAIPVGLSPHGIAITPDGTKAYVTNVFDDTVTVINTTTNTTTSA
ncbi:MAG: YncE family protein, partial [Ilumatobacteraceae bacterium]